MNPNRTRQIIKKIANTDTATTRLCKVTSVDESAFTCDVSPIENSNITYYDVRLATTQDATCVLIPKLNSTVMISPFQGGYYVTQTDIIEKVYHATETESILEIMIDFISAVKAIQLLHPQGSTVQNGVINIQDFLDIETRLKKFYLK